jgi:hypothetical protein
MSRNLSLPFFPIPPGQYDPQYFSTLVRNFSVYLDQIQQAGEGRLTGLVLTNLQEGDSGLEVGALFKQNGFVKVCEINSPHLETNVGTTAVGLVTVTTS